MELEAERLESEAEAARATEAARRTAEAAERGPEAAAKAKAEREAAAVAAEEVLRLQLEAARAEREREAALLRVRLEVEASARAELEKLALARERIALEARALQRVRPVGLLGRGLIVVAGLAVVVFGAAAARAVVAAPRPVESKGGERLVSASLFADQARELSVLREKIADLSTRAVTPQQQPPAIQPSPAVARPRASPRRQRNTESSASQQRVRALDGIESDDDDPLRGL